MARIIFTAIISIFILSSAHAGVIKDGKVTGIYCGIYGGKNMCSVYFNKESTGHPACSEYNYRMQLSADSNIGKTMLSLALAANAQGKIVYADGTGICSIQGDTEDLNILFISPKCSESHNTTGCTDL